MKKDTRTFKVVSYDTLAECGHKHRTVKGAVACRRRLLGYTKTRFVAEWHNSTILRASSEEIRQAEMELDGF